MRTVSTMSATTMHVAFKNPNSQPIASHNKNNIGPTPFTIFKISSLSMSFCYLLLYQSMKAQVVNMIALKQLMKHAAGLCIMTATTASAADMIAAIISKKNKYFSIVP